MMICGWSLSQAQIEHLSRYQTQSDFSYVDYWVIPNDQKGVSLVKALTPRIGEEVTIQFIHLNDGLKEQWNAFFKVPEGFDLKEHYFSGDTVYLLFQSRDDSRPIKIIAINVINQVVMESEPEQIVGLRLTEFAVIESTAIIAGYINGRPSAFAHNLKNNKVQVLPKLYQRNSELLELRVDKNSSTFHVLIARLDQKRDRTISVQRYDLTGMSLGSYQLKTQAHYQLLSAISSPFTDGSHIVAGLFCFKKGTNPSGIYINRIDSEGKQTINYMKFEKFRTFIDFLGESRSEKIKSQVRSANQVDRMRRYETDALLRSIREENGQLFITGEFFKPWSKNTNTYQRERDRLHPRSYYYNTEMYVWSIDQKHHLGYNAFRSTLGFTHAFGFAINRAGEILWDGSLNINRRIAGPLSRFGEFLFYDGIAYYTFYNNRQLIVKNLLDTEGKGGFAFPLDKLYSTSDMRYGRDRAQHILKWNGNKFLTYGIQYTNSPDNPGELKAIFFINSISVGPDLGSPKLD